jgi:DtxR family Mn-dependent transcriptional regulator
MERWLTDVLGLDWVMADAEAARLEHAISEVVEQRLYEALGRPRTCPHGNPIPGHSKASPREKRLATLATGARAAISRVSEVAEREAPLLLAYLDDRGLTPGRAVEVVEVDDIGRTIRIRAGKREITLSHDTAAKLWVVPT